MYAAGHNTSVAALLAAEAAASKAYAAAQSAALAARELADGNALSSLDLTNTTADLQATDSELDAERNAANTHEGN